VLCVCLFVCLFGFNQEDIVYCIVIISEFNHSFHFVVVVVVVTER
jgi:hypothetical protein